ncbi:hypothetical protein P4S73_00880 [Paraglaciecola sp. Hal342]
MHPGQIDLEDGRDIALKLFHVLNFIADEMISKPKELDLLYSDVVPEETQQHIKEKRWSMMAIYSRAHNAVLTSKLLAALEIYR